MIFLAIDKQVYPFFPCLLLPRKGLDRQLLIPLFLGLGIVCVDLRLLHHRLWRIHLRRKLTACDAGEAEQQEKETACALAVSLYLQDMLQAFLEQGLVLAETAASLRHILSLLHELQDQLTILLALLAAQLTHDRFIAGQFTELIEGTLHEIDHGIEPMETLEDRQTHFPPIVPPLQMDHLMSEDQTQLTAG